MKGEKMKKFLSLLLVLLMVLSLAACGEKTPTPTGDGENEKYSGTVMLYTSAGEDAAQSLKAVFEEDKQDVKNQDLWEQLDSLNSKLTVNWNWVKGHAGIEYNEICDQLCQKEIALHR